MQSMTSMEKYLGLLLIWGTSKTEALRFLENRIGSKAQSWKSSLLSHSCEEVMVGGAHNIRGVLAPESGTC
ncbi:conserved hypothetical protein [Ricinus communis]|uniref:Uncharacterized protein n=1 Tax=Ricinus communis TaxID=3988 RepID=B9SFW6_RICCO|nr:conserved hypothetical protein [Ricinus communis]